MMAIAAMAMFSFSSCGNDGEDDPTPDGPGLVTDDEAYQFTAPCTAWNADEEAIGKYMESMKGWRFQGFVAVDDSKQLRYTNIETGADMTYDLLGGKLINSTVIFYDSNSKIETIVNDYAKHYDITWEDMGTVEGALVYMGHSEKVSGIITLIVDVVDGQGVISVMFSCP